MMEMMSTSNSTNVNTCVQSINAIQFDANNTPSNSIHNIRQDKYTKQNIKANEASDDHLFITTEVNKNIDTTSTNHVMYSLG
jgi:hypothetical protein